MADPADDKAAYREALARAEANALEAPGETPAASPGEPQDAVPVQASDQPLPTEPAAADTPVEPTPEAPAPETVEQLRERLAATEARLAEKDNMIGRQSSEVGELRRAVEQMQNDLAAAAQAKPQVAPTTITQELIDNNPGRAVQLAYEQQNPDALAIAFEVWKDEDPFAASSWRSDKMLEEQSKRYEAELAARDARLEAVQQPQQQAAEQQAWTQAFTAVQAAHPDFLTLDAAGRSTAQRILEDVAPQFPALVAQLESGDARTKVEILTALYAADRAQNLNPVALRQQLEQEAAAAAAEEAATRGAAAGVVSQTRSGQPGVEQTPEELEQARYLDRMGSKPGLSKGWTGRT